MNEHGITVEAWNLFDRFTDNELGSLVAHAGVVQATTRSGLLNQCLIIWFHGSIPNIQTLDKLVRNYQAGPACRCDPTYCPVHGSNEAR